MEQASDEGFACTSCTPYVPKPVGKSENIAKTQTVLNDKTQNVLERLLGIPNIPYFVIFLYLLFAQ